MHPASLTHRLLDLLPADSFVLDLGCGTGLHARELARAGRRVAGLDLDLDALETARFLQEGEAGDNAEAARFAPAVPGYVAGAARALPFKNACFDAVLAVDVLHWSEDAGAFDAAWDEAWRVLRPRGLWAARLRILEAHPGAESLAGGRHRLATGAEWFLAARATLDARARGGEWVEGPVPDGDGSARFVLRKP